MRESRSYGTVGGVVRLRAGRPNPGISRHHDPPRRQPRHCNPGVPADRAWQRADGVLPVSRALSPGAHLAKLTLWSERKLRRNPLLAALLGLQLEMGGETRRRAV